MNISDAISSSWWSDEVRRFLNEDPMLGDPVVISKVTEQVRVHTALAPLEHLDALLNRIGGIEYEPSSTGPHPSYTDYVPRFWVGSADIVDSDLEPLVVTWRAGTRTVLVPDQGFLMTYGLTPRTIKSGESDEICWDDLTVPTHNVVTTKMTSRYESMVLSDAKVSIKQEYVQDYAAIRECALIQVFYAHCDFPVDLDGESFLQDSKANIEEFPGGKLEVRIHPLDTSLLSVQLWGSRLLVKPGGSPITLGRWRYDDLNWPGIEGLVTKGRALGLGTRYVYVSDKVLEKYEENPDAYEINPESGAVSYGGHWGVGWCDRVCRDLIRLEIKKLYEGLSPDIVKHWHSYAVQPPGDETYEALQGPNVGLRAKRIVYSLVELGDSIAEIAGTSLEASYSAKDFVSLDRESLDYSGWWKGEYIEPISHHIPLDMAEASFLGRCNDLNKFIVEGLEQANLRNLLNALHEDSDKFIKFGSIKLLDLLVQHLTIADETGLNFLTDAKEISERLQAKLNAFTDGDHLPSPCKSLFILYDMRIASTHRQSGIDWLLDRLDTTKASLAAGWGLLLDKFYDELADSLKEAATILK